MLCDKELFPHIVYTLTHCFTLRSALLKLSNTGVATGDPPSSMKPLAPGPVYQAAVTPWLGLQAEPELYDQTRLTRGKTQVWLTRGKLSLETVESV